MFLIDNAFDANMTKKSFLNAKIDDCGKISMSINAADILIAPNKIT